MRDYIIRVLGADYEIESVSNGEEALESASARLPDMIISDVMMPRMDGFALVQALRMRSRTRTVPIILLSARAGEEAKAEGIERGADDYLVKPFSARELQARVRTHIELKTLRTEIAAKEELLRTADKLRQSEKLAVVGRLASSIAHEINNPLEAVTNLLYLLEGAAPNAEVREYVAKAQEELARVSNITTQTLRFHRQSTNPQDIRLSEIVDGVLQLFYARITNARVAIHRDFRSEHPVRGFGGDLRQVFANLIGNAIDATETGGKIVLRLQRSVSPGSGQSGMRLTIADTGHGMTKETRKRIFEPFFTTKDLTGTGLGLWVSAEILRNHQVVMQVRSNVSPTNHGTVFSLFFPILPNQPR
jgi:signal transduction histidine kinase